MWQKTGPLAQGRSTSPSVRYFFIQELVKEGKVTIHFVKTEQLLADFGTKHLKKPRFLIKLINEFRARAGVILAYRIRVMMFIVTVALRRV